MIFNPHWPANGANDPACSETHCARFGPVAELPLGTVALSLGTVALSLGSMAHRSFARYGLFTVAKAIAAVSVGALQRLEQPARRKTMKHCSLAIALAVALLASSFAAPVQSQSFYGGYDRAGGVSSGGP